MLNSIFGPGITVLQDKGQEYWHRIRSGDKQVFEDLFRMYYKPLCGYAQTILKDLDEAEEAVQNLFFNLWSRRESLEINISVKSYLYRATHNDCLNRIKHGKVKLAYSQEVKAMAGGTVNGEESIHARELHKRIGTAVSELPEQCGMVFKLSRFENLKYQEIAERLDISVKTVENHMGKALKLLREKLKDYLPGLLWLWWFVS